MERGKERLRNQQAEKLQTDHLHIRSRVPQTDKGEDQMMYQRFTLKVGGQWTYIGRDLVPHELIDRLESEGQAINGEHAYRTVKDNWEYVRAKIAHALPMSNIHSGEWEDVPKDQMHPVMIMLLCESPKESRICDDGYVYAIKGEIE